MESQLNLFMEIEKCDVADGLEQWRVIPGFPKYECSTEGRIRRRHDCKMRKINRNCVTGYVMVGLSFGYGGRKRIGTKTKFVHRLVAITFLVDRPEKATQVNHINGIKDDNRLINLEWITPAGNQFHRRAGNQYTRSRK